jgi:hypothetical protein
LAVVESAVTIEENRVIVTGSLINTGPAAAGQVAAIATFYDSQGNVVGYYRHALEGVVASQEERPFTFVAAPPGGQVAESRFIVAGLRLGEE